MTAATRNQCRGSFFTDEASARKDLHARLHPTGYCCAGGKVSQTTQDRCSGVFARAEAEARRACRVVQVEPKPDGGLKDQILRKPPDGPVVK